MLCHACDQANRDSARFCAACGATLARSTPDLHFDRAKPYRLGQPDTLDFRVDVTAPGFTEARLEVNGPHGFGESEQVTFRLVPGATKLAALQWKPELAGGFKVNVVCELRDTNGLQHVFHGTTRVRVADASIPASSVNITVNQRASAVDLSHLNVHAASQIQDHREPEWEPIELELDETATEIARGLRRRLVGSIVSPSTERALLTLDGSDGRRIELMGGRSLRAGRLSTCDVVLRYLPETEENRAPSERLSRKQFILACDDQGVAIRSQGSAGLYLGGRLLRFGEQARLAEGPCSITAAYDGLNLSVECMLARVDGHADRTVAFLTETVGPSSVSAGPVSCVSIRRVNNAPELEYCWIVSHVDFLVDDGRGLQVAGKAGTPLVARLTRFQDRFFLEPLGDPSLTVDETPLQRGDVFVLGATHRIRFATQEWTWSASYKRT